MKFTPGYKEKFFYFLQMLFFSGAYLILLSLWKWQPLNMDMVISALMAGIVIMLLLKFRYSIVERNIEFTGDWAESLEFATYASHDGYGGRLMLSNQKLQFKGLQCLRDTVRHDIPLVNIDSISFEKLSSFSLAKNILVITTNGGCIHKFQLHICHVREWGNMLGLKKSPLGS